ncbi:methanogen output domain 1-containing protein [Catellatospora sp. KI3]|uniref:ATP-binding protein n=1 Tax=Catellatospora sp. KI3 TaxID=3041620 RepID=UPI0024827CD2|nr:ATP-binding protein [Catellatospora sp. KI3]MDI1462148.1 methanogen output domain 1-containing protein [Catellatospora sp. KI3]
MDWLLSPPTPEAGSLLRREIGTYLTRHAADAGTVPQAELTVSELIMNAVEHAGGPIWVSVDWHRTQPTITVHDLGPLFTPDLTPPRATSERGRGMWLVSQLADDLAVAAKRGGGKRVSATLPVARSVEKSFDPPARITDPLPAPDEAGPDGFGRETLLRALLVELARAVEDGAGPQRAQDLVAHVGATVGGQMEAEYRAARHIVGRLSAEQLAECYVRLKAAAGGDFYVIEVTDERIVLGNRRCPFGDAVRFSPAMCRITSSIFGGIGARNRGTVTVDLAERIAVGDQQCRVIIDLNPGPDTEGHRYQRPQTGQP